MIEDPRAALECAAYVATIIGTIIAFAMWRRKSGSDNPPRFRK